MTPKQLREWLFQNTEDDQWWLSLDAVAEDCPVTVSEIENHLKSGQYGQAQALHVSQAELVNPPWIEVELPVTLQRRRLPPVSLQQRTEPSQHAKGSGTSLTMSLFRIAMLFVAVGCIFLGFGFPLAWLLAIIALLLGATVNRAA